MTAWLTEICVLLYLNCDGLIMNKSFCREIYISVFLVFLALVSASCAPVLSQDIMKRGIKDFSLSEVRDNEMLNRGKLFIGGGIIVKTEATQEGSLIEAIYVPVNSMGYLKNLSVTDGRFLALYRGKELLDPLIFRKKREITFAGEFTGTRKGKIDEAEYIYPFFEIKQIYLWEEQPRRDYYMYPYPPPYYYPPWYYDHRPYYPWWYY